MRRSFLKSIFKIKKRWLCMWLVALLCLTGCSGIGRQNNADNVETLEEVEFSKKHADKEENPDVKEEEKATGEVCVYVCGQVRCPGVYRLDADSRICDAIKLAGGLSKNAASSFVNQAEKIEDAQKIYIPSKKEVSSVSQEKTGETAGSVATSAAGSSTGKININTAEKEALMTLPGIGESRACAIIQYRETNGKFDSIEQIKEVEGIKDGIYGKLKDQIEI